MWTRWTNRRRRRPSDEDIAREIRDHLALEGEARVTDGASADQARAAAQRAFGSVALAHEDTRAVWILGALDRLRQDLRYGVRSLTRSPGFAVVTLAILALGIGANTTIFSIVNSVLIRPLPFREPERLMMLDERLLPRFEHFEASPLDVLGWREKGRAFESIAAYVGVAFNRTGAEGPERITGMRITANLPALLGVQPVLGRVFTAEEDREGADRVVLISSGFWRRVLGADPHVVGRGLHLNGVGFTVVGVMPDAFRFPGETEIWTPMAFTKQELTGQNNHFVWGVGRLKPGVTRDQAAADMEVVMRQLPTPWRVNVTPLADHYVGQVRFALVVLLGAAGAVLLIACANVAGLLLARASTRQREIHLRASLGASRGRLVQQLVTETMVLALAGGGLGLLAAWLAIGAVRALPLAAIARLDETSLDLRVLLFTLAASTSTGLIVGLTPAFRLSRTSLQDALRGGPRVSGEGRTRWRQALVAAEIALALVLLAGAGLLLGTVWRLLEIRPGFAADHTLTARVDLPVAVYAELAQRRQFAEEVVARLQRVPGVHAAGISSGLPFVSVGDTGVTFETIPAGSANPGAASNHYRVTPQYFRTLGIPLIRGRLFSDQDTPDRPPVAIINETVARRFFAGQDPLGKRLGISDDPRFWREIVGVVGDVKQEGLRAPIAPQVYEPFAQRPRRSFSIVVRALGDPTSLAGEVRRAVLAVDPHQPLSNMQTLDTLIARSITRDRFAAWLLATFGALAALLAAIGIYGLMAYSVARRTNEIGLRMALGADRRGILRLVLGESLRPLGIGLVVGIIGALTVTRVLGTLLYEIQPRDPATLGAAVTLLAVTALVAAFIPARRAARVDPMTALRTE
jgi:predicted permease